MHKNEGPNVDTTSVPGASLAKTSPLPATTINPEHWNAATQEIINVILDAELSLAGSAAADRTAGWAQLKTAIRIVANKRLSESFGSSGGFSATPQDVPITANAQAVTPDRFAVRLTGTAAVDNWTVGLQNGSFNNKLILVENNTDAVLFVNFARMAPGSFRFFFYDPTTITFPTNWIPIGYLTTDELVEGNNNLYYLDSRVTSRVQDDLGFDGTTQGLVVTIANGAFDTRLATKSTDNLAESATKKYVNKASGSFAMHLYDASNVDRANGTATYEVIDGVVYLTIPLLSYSPSGSTTLRLTSASDAALPSDIHVGADRCASVWTIKDSDTAYAPVRAVIAASDNKIALSGWHPTSYAEVPSITITYRV